MKRIFNRTKRPQQEWKGYDESEYDWDSAEQGDDNDAFYADDQEYYAGEDGFTEDDGAYYAEGDFVEDDGAYYAEDGFTEDDGAYYAEGDFAEDDGAYYAEESSYAEDDETYYEENPAGTGDDGNYYAYDADMIGEDAGSYNEDAYYSGEDYEEYAAEDRADRSRSDGFWAKLGKSLASMSGLDQAIIGTGAAVLVLALVIGGIYISNRIVATQISDFVNVGTQLAGIDTIGEAGLLAVEDAQMAKMSAASVVDGLDGNKGYDEQDYNREVQVGMELVSIQKDLKIKFINKDTGKLVANVPFAVKVTDPDGKDSIWSDDDMDGIIYKKDITAGSYKLAMETLADEKYARFIISTAAETTTVKKNIEYKKVNVDNEIKSESEVDAKKEDTKVNETEVESALTDTVAWVASTVTPASYIEVPKSSITDPKNLVAQVLDKTFLRATGTDTVSGNGSTTPSPDTTTGPENSPDPSEEPSESPSTDPSTSPSASPKPAELTLKLDMTTVSVSVGNTAYVQVSAWAGETDVTSEVTFSVSDTSGDITVNNTDSPGKVTVKGTSNKVGTTPYTITATPKDPAKYTNGAISLSVTVTAAKTISLDKTELTLLAGETATLTATVSNMAPNIPNVTAESSNANVVKVVKSEKNVVTIEALKEDDQVVTVTVTYKDEDGNSISAKCLVKVKSNPEKDTTTKLKDSKGTQLYVKVDDKTYREAVYADYYKDVKLYVMGEAKYTGWQTIDGKVYFFTSDGKKVTGEQVIQGAKYNFASDGSLVQGSGALGIDVSKWNGTIDWNAVKNSGINYVIIRCGYRGSTAGSLIEDPQFITNIKGATAAGLKVGVYFFTQAIDEREAVEEASMVISQIKNYKISYPVFLDVESSGGRADSIDRATRTAVCKAFCETIKSAGYTPGIYANKNWWETKINASELTAYKIWLAQYAAAATYKTTRYDLWQYRSTGRVSGITGDVDLNLSYLGY